MTKLMRRWSINLFRLEFACWRLPHFDGVAYVIALMPVGGIFVVFRPRFWFQFQGMNSRLDAPEWVKLLMD